MICFAPPYCSQSFSWHDCNTNIYNEVKIFTWTSKVPDNLTLSYIIIITFIVFFLPVIHLLFSFYCLLSLLYFPDYLYHVLFIRFLGVSLNSSFKIHLSWTILSIFSSTVTYSHNSDLLSMTQQVLLWWNANIGAAGLFLASLSEPMICASMSWCGG